MTDNNVINFPQVGFTLSPSGTPAPPVTPPRPTTPPTIPAPPTTAPSGGRRSPLAALAALPAPGILQPARTPAPAPVPGAVPATFRTDPGSSDLIGPRLGALSLAAVLAVAVAALRGSHTLVSSWWEHRQAKHAEGDKIREARTKHELAMQGLHDKAALQRAKQKVPSSHEFGRKTLGGGGRSGGGPGRGGGKNSGSTGGGRGRGPAGSHHSAPEGPGGSKNRSHRGGASTGLLTPSKKNRNHGSGNGSGGRKHRDTTGSGSSGGSTPKQPGPNRLTQHSRLRKNSPKNKTPRTPNSPAAPNSSGRNNPGPGTTGPGSGVGTGRTTLRQAAVDQAHKAAARRLKKRRKNPVQPPVWSAGKTPKPKTPKQLKKKPKQPQTPGGTTAPAPPNTPQVGTTPTKTRRQKKTRITLARAAARQAASVAARRLKRRRARMGVPPIWTSPRTRRATRGWWARVTAHAKNKTARSGCFTGTAPGSSGATGGTFGPGPSTGTKTGPGPTGGGPRQRRSPFQNAAQAAGTTYTVTSVHVPGSRAKTWASTPHTARPGTTRPKKAIPMPPSSPARVDPRISKARKQAARTGSQALGRHMDAQHETEISLDDALDNYEGFVTDGFKTHDQSAKLARRARTLRDTLLQFSEQLAVDNNLIGPLFSAAMANLSESMDLLARMSDEMQVSSLEAAETAETAGNDLNDAYRPITQATADAGLTTPSAPVHNET
ncbi:hypothetical protein SUDANB145_07225 (plasmid) [Streptomyces sp. enrichment culture]|uniref:hypothetical protein n=1 Tax=Streptomyces sp. enrichment culture TaxID=1795815 RepID=UPI003F55B558